jgi:hypothetical protein
MDVFEREFRIYEKIIVEQEVLRRLIVASEALNCPACCELLSTKENQLFFCANCNKYFLIFEMSKEEAKEILNAFDNLVSKEEYDLIKKAQ